MTALRIVEDRKNFNGYLRTASRTVIAVSKRIRASARQNSRLYPVLVLLSVLMTSASPGLSAEPEIDGLVIDQTLTRVGAELYRNFVLFWEPPKEEGIKGYTIAIVERASAQWGFWIWVLVNDTVVFQKVMKPQADDIEADAHAAVAITRRYLIEQSRGKNIRLPDLKGDGI